KVWDDEVNKQGLNKVICASPTLSLSSDDVVYFMTTLKSEGLETLLLSVNATEAKVEAVEVVSFELSFCPCAFSSFDRARPGALPAGDRHGQSIKAGYHELEQGAISNHLRQASSKAKNVYTRAIGDIFELAPQGDLSVHKEAHQQQNQCCTWSFRQVCEN
ncbi:hypothetical protein C2845_PM01G11980, partial [Panicum miliaceum]